MTRCAGKTWKNPSLFYDFGFFKFNNINDPEIKETEKMSANCNEIFKMKYIFMPIHQEKHHTCVIISMKKKEIKYYDSLLLNQTRSRGGQN